MLGIQNGSSGLFRSSLGGRFGDEGIELPARQHTAEVMIAGEQLRLRLHDGKLIKDRRYHLRTYPNCFVAEELIDWLVNHEEAPDRATAVRLMQHLMDRDVVHHVCDKRSEFKDAKLLYRFRKDDGTFPFNKEVKLFMRGQRLYEHLSGDKSSILQQREECGVVYQRSFPGCQLIDWLLQNGEAASRCQGLELCCALQEHGIMQHVAQKHDFFDSGLHYQFCINFRRRRRLSELLGERERDAWIPLRLTRQDWVQLFVCLRPRSFEAIQNQARIQLKCDSVQFLWFKSRSKCLLGLAVLKRHFTCEELLAPGAHFTKRVDALGWGFVIRGVAPCYVQAVDPGSPAAAAGVKGRADSSLVFQTWSEALITRPPWRRTCALSPF
uniref:Activity-dependent neuroprotector homeobox a n=1 Tax=Hippocampus comes TaxID=109280 RepID=A0A3Q2XEE7_HIPCM